jgi:excinuclease ABC subunit C
MGMLEQKLSQIPLEPGVYLYKNAAGRIIYVGKAKSLKNRVRSYFQDSRSDDYKLSHLRAEIDDVEFIVVDSEMEALALENNLIKQYQPKFNVLLRDDKTFPYLKLTVNEGFPRILITRKRHKDGASYYGPYIKASLAAQAYKLISRHFQIRTCTIPIDGKRPRPCLDYHIHRCMAPCVASLCGESSYAARVLDLKLFMEGKTAELIKSLTAQMHQAAEAERYELAAHLRDMLRTIDQLAEPQKISSTQSLDLDIFALHREGSKAAIQLFHMRNGRVVDRREFFWEGIEEEVLDEEILSSLLKQYYFLSEFTPDEVHICRGFEDSDAVAQLLSQKKKKKVEIRVPQRGPRKAFMDMATRNARLAFEQRFRVLAPDHQKIAAELADVIGLGVPPRRIECFDISNIQGTDSVASMVVWENGKIKKSDYRKFIIKTVEGADDFKSMREVVFRRYHRLLEEKKPLPDLILVDGGLGQLHAAADALDELDLTSHALASIAKKEEILYVRGLESEPIQLPNDSPVLHLIQTLRDESHRFAVSFHRQRRSKRTLTSELLNIPGVGKKNRQMLLVKFGSLQNVKTASLEQLQDQLPPSLSQRIYRHFHPSSEK